MSITLYGERGLVNSIVLEISDNIDLIRKVLGAVKLGNDSVFDWLDDITAVDFWIEPSFGQFGDPDLILICKSSGNEKHVIFFEAKTADYIDSAMPLAWKYFPGINSRINAQLTLKYRFVQALTLGKSATGIIEESPDIADAYARQLCTDDKQNGHARKLLNSYVVSHCQEMQSNCRGFYFVALTNDGPDVSIDNIDSELLPAVFDNHGINIWEIEKYKFGILSYKQLEDILPPDGIFATTRKIVLPDPIPNASAGDAPVLKTINWNKFTPPIMDLRSVLQKLIIGVASEVYGDKQEVIKCYEYAGSDSFKGSKNNTIIKIIPYKGQTGELLLLAVKDSLVSASQSPDYFNQGPFRIGIGANAGDFCGHFLTAANSDEEWEECRDHLFVIITID